MKLTPAQQTAADAHAAALTEWQVKSAAAVYARTAARDADVEEQLAMKALEKANAEFRRSLGPTAPSLQAEVHRLVAPFGRQP